MKKNDELERNLLKLFSKSTGKKNEDYLIEKIQDNTLAVIEKQKSGEGEVTFNNGSFIKFSTTMLGKKLNSFFKVEKNFSPGMICDGIFLTHLGDRIILGLVELKKKVNNDFRRAIRQIEGSYLKTTMLLSLLYDIKDVEPIVFIAGNIDSDPDLDYLYKMEKFEEIEDKPGTLLKELSDNREAHMNVPFFLDKDISIHENYKKKKIKVYHLDFDDTFDIRTL